jgi:hypothetical protein
MPGVRDIPPLEELGFVPYEVAGGPDRPTGNFPVYQAVVGVAETLDVLVLLTEPIEWFQDHKIQTFFAGDRIYVRNNGGFSIREGDVIHFTQTTEPYSYMVVGVGTGHQGETFYASGT